MTSEVEITDEITRAALDVLAGKAGGCPGLTLHDACDDTQCGCKEEVRAALSAVAPLISRASYERGQRDMLDKLLTLNPEVNAKIAAMWERVPDPEGRIPFDAAAWITLVADQCGITLKADPTLPTGGENG